MPVLGPIARFFQTQLDRVVTIDDVENGTKIPRDNIRKALYMAKYQEARWADNLEVIDPGYAWRLNTNERAPHVPISPIEMSTDELHDRLGQIVRGQHDHDEAPDTLYVVKRYPDYILLDDDNGQLYKAERIA